MILFKQIKRSFSLFQYDTACTDTFFRRSVIYIQWNPNFDRILTGLKRRVDFLFSIFTLFVTFSCAFIETTPTTNASDNKYFLIFLKQK